MKHLNLLNNLLLQHVDSSRVGPVTYQHLLMGRATCHVLKKNEQALPNTTVVYQ